MKDKTSSNPPEIERFEVGPLTFERKGRFISIKSSINSNNKVDFLQEMKKLHPEIKKEIDNAIRELTIQIQSYDPRDFLESISIDNCFYDAESYSESQHEGLEAYAEYALSLALADPFCEARPNPSKDELDKFSKNISLVFSNIGWYFTTEKSDVSHGQELHEFRYSSIMSSLIIRGDSVEPHHTDLVKGSFGFDINQILSFISEISDQVSNRYNQQRLCLCKGAELHKLFCEYSEKPENVSKSEKESVENFFEIEENKKKKDEVDSLKPILTEEIFEISPNERLPIQFIEKISVPFGSNSQFADGTEYNGWPTNTSIIYYCPVVSYDEKYYSFVPPLLFRNIIGILERWILRADESYYQKKYLPRKSEYLEQKSLEYISNILPHAQIFGKLFYTITENGVIKNPETDGLVIYDDNLFIIEVKSGQFHPSARRGSIEKIKKDIEKLISGAYDQALRTKKYIFSTTKPVFKYRSGKIALEIEDTSRFRNIFLVNITLENLNHLSTHLNSLKKFGLIEGREWPWSVYLNDLRTISELIDTPSEFLLYLQRRIRANDFPVFSATDELDFLMVFFNEGLYFEDGHLDKVDLYKPMGYTDAIDRYYHSQMGLVSDGEKPTLKIPLGYRNLIKNIEKTQKCGFTHVTTTLLSFNSDTHQKILDCIDRLSERAENDGKCHDATLIFNNLKLGITLVFDTNNVCNPSKYHAYTNLKKYQTHFDEWIILFIKISQKQIEQVNFELIEVPWKYSQELERKLKENRLSSNGAHPNIGRRIGRNEKCPCGSGVKFKRCCGKGIMKEKI